MKLELRAMIRKEFRQVFRDPHTLGILLLVPMLLLVLFGYAISMDVDNIVVGVLDNDKSPESRRITELFQVLDVFSPGESPTSPAEAEEALVDGRLNAALVIPSGFGRDLEAGKSPSLQLLIDGSNVLVASTAQGYIDAMFFDLSLRLDTEWRVPTAAGAATFTPPIDFRPRTWFNPELRSTVFLIPGLIAFIMVITAVLSTALSVVREKEKGTMEMLDASPLSSTTLIIGKTVPFMVISMLETVLILIAGRFLFGVGIMGSISLLLGITFLFLLSCLGIGLLISTVVDTQQSAFLLATIVIVLPTLILSGFIYPIRNMPLPVQAVTFLIPARYFITAERALMIRGAGAGSIWPQSVVLLGFSIFTLGLSSLRLGRRRRKR
ncbi:MAG: ABC transporter permease [Spirochaetaceae bacterium]|nr:ABC transporter permease [Spirochaetaceae bacterium]RKX72968.1 MAG: ABC transporter permease [Spirochaetota bacterium]RKX88749.1 MAG: ABC transporter permease [Spirochaetota bacterium]RKX90830.1 MAG: ABC transporter permease [Spirochaetota bacterium]